MAREGYLEQAAWFVAANAVGAVIWWGVSAALDHYAKEAKTP